MKVRPAGPEDAVALSQAHAFGFDSPWRPAEFAALLTNPGVFALLAQLGCDCGMILCRAVVDEVEVLTIAVDSGRRGKGIGRALLTAAMNHAQAAGAVTAFLEVGVDNAAALALYGRAGFRRTGLRKNYYDRGDGEPADALVMRLDFPAGRA